jgi:hypothetical protein
VGFVYTGQSTDDEQQGCEESKPVGDSHSFVCGQTNHFAFQNEQIVFIS